MQDSKVILIPKEYNYVAAFLTLGCNYRCTYCINRPTGQLNPRSLMSGSQWISYLNRLQLPHDLPISFQGGEPSQHPDFFEILNGVRPDLNIDLLTNLSFDVEAFAQSVSPQRFLRSSPYASIRVTYHPGQSPVDELFDKLIYLQERGFPVGLYSIRRPGHEKLIEKVHQRAQSLGLDHRSKEYLGLSQGKIYGTYHYPNGVFSSERRSVSCRTSELLMAPNGDIFRCHRDLYLNESSIGSVLDSFQPAFVFRSCDRFGDCNPCDLKRKTNRFQQDGHASVEIREMQYV